MLGRIIKREREIAGISQEALAHGVCAVSYLSKIENEHVKSSPDILAALSLKLGIDYIDEEQEMMHFRSLLEAWFERALYEDISADIYTNTLYKCAIRMLYSDESINATLYLQFHEFFVNRQPVQLELLEGFIFEMDDRQRVLYSILKSYHLQTCDDNMLAINVLKHALMYDAFGLIQLQLVSVYFYSGLYHEAIEMGKKALINFAESARLNAMHQVTALLAYSYSNIFDEKNMMHYYQLGHKYQIYLKNPLYAEDNYNIGASYFNLGKYEIAREYLERALNDRTSETDLVRQKLGLVYALLGERDKALEQVKVLSKSKEVIYQKSAKVITLMAQNENYVLSLEYIATLESCFTYTKELKHHGFQQFFALLLKDAYIKNRMYKKALDLTEKFKIS